MSMAQELGGHVFILEPFISGVMVQPNWKVRMILVYEKFFQNSVLVGAKKAHWLDTYDVR